MASSRAFLLILVAILLALSILLVVPFLQYFLLAVVLAFILTPVQSRLEERIGKRFAAGTVVFGSTVAIIIPLVVVTSAVAADAAALFEAIQDGDLELEDIEAPIEQVTGLDVALGELLQTVASNGGAEAFGSILGAFGAVTHAVVGLGLTVFLLYYFLKDRESFVAWLRWVLPLPRELQDDLFEELDSITWAVMAGHVFVAIIQGVIAGAGLYVAGVPNALFWTALMIVLALLPVVGSFLIWGPAAVYLVLVGQPVAGAVLFAYGVLVVGISDDYLRPIVVDRYASVNPTVIILGVLGGLYALGFMGMFIGPIVIGALRATMDVYRDHYGSPGGT